MPVNFTLIPSAQYIEHLDGASTSGEDTVRLFASLSLVRLHPDVTSRAAAAEALNMPGPMGCVAPVPAPPPCSSAQTNGRARSGGPGKRPNGATNEPPKPRYTTGSA